MYKFPIAVLNESFRTDLETALDKAKDIGLQGVQIYATKGDMSPEELEALKKRKESSIW